MPDRMSQPAEPEAPIAATDERPLVRRHRLGTRIWHWINAITVFVMLMSGLMIFNAHPRLYWGQYGANADTPWLSIGSTATKGFVEFDGKQFETTGVLGHWRNGEGEVNRRAFPGWATIPSYYSLPGARRWHLAFAWILSIGLLIFLIASLVNRHLQRDLAPTFAELAPRHVWQDIWDHVRLRYPTGEAALRYNILQKLAYLGVIVLLLPLLILTGLTMSPAIDAAAPWLLDLFGGRQSARSIHFIAATLVLLFIVVHLIQVVLAGPINEIRSMITGRFRLPKERGT
jgi:thiosulfate reductase cytochrome b subunit